MRSAEEPEIAALIFDMDGLLVDSETLNEEVVQALLRHHDCHIAWTQKQTEELMGKRIPEVLAVIARICDIRTPIETLVGAFETHRLEVMRGRLQAMPGALEVTALGRAFGWQTALVTSGRRDYVDAVLAETRLAGSFDVEVTGEDVPVGKPAPDGYLLAASRLNVAPEACIVFEDAPNGIAAAVAAGMQAVAVPNMYTRGLEFQVAPTMFLPDLHAATSWLNGNGRAAESTSGQQAPVGPAAASSNAAIDA